MRSKGRNAGKIRGAAKTKSQPGIVTTAFSKDRMVMIMMDYLLKMIKDLKVLKLA